jgi:3-oxoadipyl-CoA thiolase
VLAIVLPCPGSPLLKARFGVNSIARDGGERGTAVQRGPRRSRRARAAQPATYCGGNRRLQAREEIVEVTIQARNGDAVGFRQDEHPRATRLDALSKLKGVVSPDGTVTAGNASGVNKAS